jgi:hypothetical protein
MTGPNEPHGLMTDVGGVPTHQEFGRNGHDNCEHRRPNGKKDAAICTAGIAEPRRRAEVP